MSRDNVTELSAKLAAKVKDGALITSDKGAIKPCEHNARLLLSQEADFADLHFDEFLYRLRIGERDWTDHDDREALCRLQSTHRVAGFTLGQVRNAAMSLAFARRRDSLRDFVRALAPWDGVERIDHAFVDALGALDTPLTRAASRNLLIAMAARAVKPGCQVDTLWVFEGPQGTFKSKAMRALGGSLHAEITAPLGTSDFFRELRGVWLAELGELDAFRGREASTIKRILSSPADRFVEKYEKHAVAYPRRAVAVATTNEAVYWQDPTGARRLVPIKVGEIRLDVIAQNRLSWFAEALHLFDAGAAWWKFPEEIVYEQEERQDVDPWVDLLRDAMVNGRRDGLGTIRWPAGWIASAEIMGVWLDLDAKQQGPTSGRRLGAVMRQLGYLPDRRGKTRERGWIPDASDAGKR